ncbi:MAG: ABC transporter substrate-binding protein [Bacteroides sp.]|nr:ABC transporter substrate-binding protein [Roseburia sp.]MCM1345464.1 ABC transporter substrate-binding protein [Bacteroides sp.]MCM1421802.1 ABC transporter substrate-binding protein [Bacteroides sp.]
MNRIIPLLITAMSTLFVCCDRNGNNHNSDSQSDSTVLRIAVLPTTDCLPFYMADQCGIFDSLGLHIQLVTFNAAADCDTAFIGGSIDGMVSDMVKAVVMRSKGDSVKAVMGTELNVYMLAAKNARIKRVSSIKEKIFAITRNSALDLTTDKILEAANMGSEELNKPQINDIKLRAKMLDQNQYDGALLPEPYASACMTKGAVKITDAEKTKLNLSAVVFRENAITTKGEQIKMLTKAYDSAIERIANMTKENADTDKKGASATNAVRLISYIPSGITLHDSINIILPQKTASIPDETVFKEVVEWAKGRSLLKKEVKYTDIVDTTFIDSKPVGKPLQNKKNQ